MRQTPGSCANLMGILLLALAGVSCARPEQWKGPDSERADTSISSSDVRPGDGSDVPSQESDVIPGLDAIDAESRSETLIADAPMDEPAAPMEKDAGPATCGSACAPGDGCCPPGCASTSDGDCPVKCGNGVVEIGETCDPVTACAQRQAACVSDKDTLRVPSGEPVFCSFACAESKRPCGPADGHCPSGCAASGMDGDCKQPDGSKCERGSQCLSNFCVDGVCCENGCDGFCQACTSSSTSKPDGKCAPVRAGADPRSACPATEPDACGNDGSCDGAGACRKHGTSTACGAAACSPDRKSRLSERKCDGRGACAPATSNACGSGEECQQNRCVSTCGELDQACCELQSCKNGLTCLTLTTPARCGRCGGIGQVCCDGPSGATCNVGQCFANPNGTLCENCGKVGQRCCKPGNTCTDGTCEPPNPVDIRFCR